MIFPITYVEIVIWLVFISWDYPQDYFMRWIIKFFGVFLGIIITIKSIAGEQWLTIDSSNNLALSVFNDGFALPISIFVLGTSIYILFSLMQSLINKDYEKEGANA